MEREKEREKEKREKERIKRKKEREKERERERREAKNKFYSLHKIWINMKMKERLMIIKKNYNYQKIWQKNILKKEKKKMICLNKSQKNFGKE